jgi:hypothetical protein
MPVPGFAIKLSQLLAVGRLYLPYLADSYATMNNKVAATADYDASAFPPLPSTEPTNPVRGPWTELRDRLQNYLGQGSRNFTAAGESIVYIANTYAATDATTEHEVRQAWSGGAPASFGFSYTTKPVPLPPPPQHVVMAPNG